MNTGESFVTSLLRWEISMEKIIELAIADMNRNIISAQLEAEKYPIEDLEKLSTAELLKLLWSIQSRLHTIRTYMENAEKAHKQIQKPDQNAPINLSFVLVNLVTIFEEAIVTSFELWNLQETYRNILRILDKRLNNK